MVNLKETKCLTHPPFQFSPSIRCISGDVIFPSKSDKFTKIRIKKQGQEVVAAPGPANMVIHLKILSSTDAFGET